MASRAGAATGDLEHGGGAGAFRARGAAGGNPGVVQAATYEQALSLAAAYDLQLLLTDSVMPRMSGQTLAGRITETRPGLPVVYMSGYSPFPDQFLAPQGHPLPDARQHGLAVNLGHEGTLLIPRHLSRDVRPTAGRGA